MPVDPHAAAHLAALIGAARAEAERMGPEGATIGDLLSQAFAAAQALEARHGRADEGLRPEQLTTDNDE